MSNTKKQCKTRDEQCETDQSKYTQVKTVYARAAIILLAINFCLTGYVLNSVLEMQDEQSQSYSSTVQGGQTVSSTTTVDEVVPTLKKEDN